MSDKPNDEPRTTVNLYTTDLEWLKQRQLRVSGAAKKWLTMPDVLRELIREADMASQEGIVMVPLIENIDAYNQRTAELRAQGNTAEADKRDWFARQGERT